MPGAPSGGNCPKSFMHDGSPRDLEEKPLQIPAAAPHRCMAFGTDLVRGEPSRRGPSPPSQSAVFDSCKVRTGPGARRLWAGMAPWLRKLHLIRDWSAALASQERRMRFLGRLLVDITAILRLTWDVVCKLLQGRGQRPSRCLSRSAWNWRKRAFCMSMRRETTAPGLPFLVLPALSGFCPDLDFHPASGVIRISCPSFSARTEA
jgi:hypothetical protein